MDFFYSVVQLHFTIGQAVFSSEKDKTIYKQMCKEALDRLTKFVDANSVYEKDLRNMKKDLLAAYYFE